MEYYDSAIQFAIKIIISDWRAYSQIVNGHGILIQLLATFQVTKMVLVVVVFFFGGEMGGI